MSGDIKSVGVRLYALNADFKKGMKESSDSTSAFGKASTVALAAAGTAAVAFALKAADSYVAYGRSIMGLSRISGENIETSSKMAYAAQQSGISVEQLGKSYKFLEQGMKSGKQVFSDYGIKIKDANGEFRDTHAVFLDVADAVAKATNPVDRLAIASGALGARVGKDMLPMLMKGKQGILDLEAGAQSLGLVLTKDNVAAISENVKAHRDLDAAMQGLQIRIGQDVLPVLTKVTQVMAGLPGPVGSAIVPIGGLTVALLGTVKAYQTLSPLVGTVVDGLKSTGGALKNMTGGQVVAAAGAMALVAVAVEYNKILQDQAKLLTNIGDQQAASDTYDTLTQQIKKNNDELAVQRDKGKNDFWVWDRVAADAAGDAIAANTDKQQKYLNVADSLTASTGRSKEETLKWVQAEAAAGRTYDDTSTALAAFTGVIDLNTMSADDAAKAIKSMDDATKALNDTEHAAIDPQFAMIDATNKNADAQKKAADAQWAIVFAQGEYNNAVAIWGSSSFEAMAKLQALTDAKKAGVTADLDATKSAADLDYATNNLKNAFDTHKASTQQSTDLLYGWVTAGKITGDQAITTATQFGILTDYLNNMPKDVWITIHQQQIDTVTNLQGVTSSKAAAHHGGWTGNAMGGVMMDGDGYVGENGRERYSKRGGLVTLTPTSSRGNFSQGRSGGDSGGSQAPVIHQEYHITVDAPNYVGDKRDFDRQVEESVKRAVKA